MKLRRKIAQSDFTADMLPSTRPEVFKDVLRLHWFVFIKLGLLLLVVYLPILMINVLNDAYEIRRIEELAENATVEIIQTALGEIVSFRSSSAVICIIFYVLFGVVLSGILRAIRQFVWEEIVFLWKDIWKGIRQNKVQAAGIFTIIGLQNLVGIYLVGTGQATGNQMFSMIGTIFNGMSLLLFFPVWALMLVQISVYSNNFVQNMKLAFAVYAKSILKTLMVLLALAIPWCISLLPNFWCHLIGQVLGVFLLPVMLLIWFLYVFSLLDKHINPIYFPEIVGKGLYKKKENSDG